MLQHKVPATQTHSNETMSSNFKKKKKGIVTPLYLLCRVLIYLTLSYRTFPSCLFKVVSPLAEIQKQILLCQQKGERCKDILTGICYSHRHHAASEHEGALLV